MSRTAKLIVVFAILLAGSLGPTLLLSKKPEVVVGEMLAKLAEDRSFWGAATVGMIAPASVMEAAGADPNAIVPIVFVGQVGMNLPAGQPFSGKGTFSLSSADEATPLTLDVLATQDGTSYAKLTNLPSGDDEGSAIVKALDGQWFSMPSRTLAGIVTRSASNPADAENSADGGRPAATWQTVREQLIDGDLYGVPRPLGIADLRSPFIRRYALPVLPKPLTELMQDVRSLQLGRSLSAEELDAIAAKVAANNVGLEIWVDVRTKNLQQVSVVVAEIDQTNPLIDRSHFTMVLRFTAWDEPVDVTVPEQSRPYSDIVMPAPRTTTEPQP